VYAHDGQNLFDPKTSFLRVDWGVDETMTKLVESGTTDGAIVVAIWNTPQRVHEYLPRSMLLGLRGTPRGQQLEKELGQVGVKIDQENLLQFLLQHVQQLASPIERYRKLEFPPMSRTLTRAGRTVSHSNSRSSTPPTLPLSGTRSRTITHSSGP
jgi:hypothetical protein